MITANNVHASFGSNHVLRGVSLELAEGSIAGLIGPSGSGKSVLMKILGHVREPDDGAIRLDRCEVSDVSLMFQEGALFDSLSVFDNVAFPLVQGRGRIETLPRSERESVRQKVQEILARVGLTSAAWKMPGQLSGGMRRRVSLARAVVSRPRVVLLDDPTCGLDPVASSVIMKLVIELHQEYLPTMIMVSHDLRRLLPAVDTIFALFDGKVCFHGSLDELVKNASDRVKNFVSCRYDLKAAA